jgi:small subunit ribosomal protein S1
LTEKELTNQESAGENQQDSGENSDAQSSSKVEETQAAAKPAPESVEESAKEEEATEAAEETTEAEEEAPAEETAEEVAEESAAQEEEAEEAPAEEEKAEEEEPKAEEKKEEKASKKPAKEEVAAEDNGAHDDFDWSVNKRNVSQYTDLERARLEEEYENTLTTVNENEIVEGTVVSMNDSEVVLNIGFKSDGMVPRTEFRDVDELRVGDPVDVYVEQKEDKKGQLVLSRRKAKLLKAWENIVDAYHNDKIVKGTVISKTKGGLIVNVHALETFLPGSQIDVKPIIDYDAYVGKTMEFKVVKINEAIKNAGVSHKALIESDLEDQRMQIISKLEKGQVLEGIVKNITDFGAFIDLGGVDGLLYITDISWGRINHPSEVLELNQKLNVVVLDFDDDKKRISLGLKQLQSHPWDTLSADIEVGSKVKGKIVNIEDYGAFLEIIPGVEGLIHVSEVSWSNQPVNSREYFKLGEDHEAIVMTIDREERKMSLSLKRLTTDPWEGIEAKYPLNSRHTGEVKNITPYGVFVELEEGIGGMVHISDLSWTKRFSHPSEFTKVGEDLEIVILDIDNENRKLSLGHKQIEEDPWDTFETVFPVGSVHEGNVISRDDKGAFAPARHIKKEDGTLPEADEKLEVKVIEFSRNDKKIIVSHTRLFDDAKKEEDESEKTRRKADSDKARKTVKRMNRQVEKTTLGELEILSEIKEKMQQDAKDELDKKSDGKKKEAKKDESAEETSEDNSNDDSNESEE